MRLIKMQKGQSMLEMVFALGILLFVVAAILALVTSNVWGQKESESQIIANNLAREGIEVVRSIRDSNWLAQDAWDKGLDGGNNAVAVFDSGTNTWQLDFSPSNYVLNISNDGIYGDPGLGQPSAFSRQLFFVNICQQSSGAEVMRDNCLVGEVKIGTKVTSVVGWQERGRQRQVSLEYLLYEWK